MLNVALVLIFWRKFFFFFFGNYTSSYSVVQTAIGGNTLCMLLMLRLCRSGSGNAGGAAAINRGPG